MIHKVLYSMYNHLEISIWTHLLSSYFGIPVSTSVTWYSIVLRTHSYQLGLANISYCNAYIDILPVFCHVMTYHEIHKNLEI